jgi:hypothetical protein
MALSLPFRDGLGVTDRSDLLLWPELVVPVPEVALLPWSTDSDEVTKLGDTNERGRDEEAEADVGAVEVTVAVGVGVPEGLSI